MKQTGSIIVVSAPSGAGKDTIIGAAIAADERIVHAVSVTTRQPRNSEVHGTHYWFMDIEEFKHKICQDDFIEWANVHGNLYGTLHSEVDRQISTGHDVVLELDIQGMRSLTTLEPDAKTVFIMPPSIDILEQRIRDRGGLEEADIQTRLQNAEIEMLARNEYNYIIVNDVLTDAVNEFVEIVKQLRED
jgi:guanylate kinase